MKGKKVIPIVFSGNDKYAPYASVTANSIIRNSDRRYFYRFYLLYTELLQSIIMRLEEICGENYSFTCVNVKKWCAEGMYSAAYFSEEMYYRIMIPEIFREYKKVLYLDCDIVVLKDITELYNFELKENLLGGVQNLMHDKMKKYIKFSLQLEPEKYINSGVLLFNSEVCRKEKFMEKSFEMLSCRPDLRYPDQDLINLICENRISYLDPLWNFTWHYRYLKESRNKDLHLSDADMEKFLKYEKEAKLIHYTGEVKPWNNSNRYLSDYFWLYAKDSIFFNLFLIGLINQMIREHRTAPESIEAEIKELQQQVNSIKDGMALMTKERSSIQNENSSNSIDHINMLYHEDYESMVLASENGKVGIKVIWKMLCGWFKFKIKV